MTANMWLILFLIAFWVLIWIALKVNHLIHRRPLRDGPSLIPVVPLVPIAGFGAGWLLNLAFAPAGTIAVVSLHLGYVIYAVIAGYFRRPIRKRDK
jgi:hypothetical protein